MLIGVLFVAGVALRIYRRRKDKTIAGDDAGRAVRAAGTVIP